MDMDSIPPWEAPDPGQPARAEASQPVTGRLAAGRRSTLLYEVKAFY